MFSMPYICGGLSGPLKALFIMSVTFLMALINEVIKFSNESKRRSNLDLGQQKRWKGKIRFLWDDDKIVSSRVKQPEVLIVLS